MSLRIVFKLLVVFWASTAVAQEVAHYEVFDVDNGLPSNEIYDVEESGDGYLWIATDRGVGKFDGEHFEVFSSNDGLIDNCILSIHRDSYDRLWFAGLSRQFSYLDDEHFIDFEGNGMLVKQNEQYANHLYVHHSKDQIYFGPVGSVRGVYKPMENLFVYNHAGDFLDSISSSYFNNSQGIEIFHVDNGAIIVLPDFLFFHEFDYADKNLAKDQQFSKFTEHILPIIEFINQAVKVNSTDNPIKIRTLRRFNERYYLATSSGFWSFSTPLHPSSEINIMLPDVNATSSSVDREGNIWLTTVNSGLIKIANEQFVKFNELITSNQDHPISLRAYKDKLLVSTEKAKLYTIEKNHSIKKITDDFLLRRFPEKIETFQILNQPNLSGGKRVFKNAQIFYVLENDINLTHQMLPLEVRNQKLELKRAFGFAHQNDKIWIATIKGLKQFNYFKQGQNNVYDLDSTFFKNDRISDVRAFDKGIIFSGLSNGLYFLKDNICHKLNHSELDNQVINCLKVENDTTLWLGTNIGLLRAHIQSIDDQVSVNDIKKYTTKDGIISNFILDIESFNSNLWVATPKGLMYFDPTKIEKIVSAPLIYLKEYRANKHKFNLDSIELPHLNYDQNNIQIEFSGVCNQRPIDLPFYHFELSKNGTEVTSNSQNASIVKFSDLAHGEYNLKLWATNRAKIQSKPIELNWIIRPHWTNTGLFNVLMILLIIGIVFLFFKARSQKLSKERQLAYHLKDMELRSLRGQLNPHFIFNVLNSIQLYIYKNNQKEAVLFLKKFANLMRSFLEQSKLDFISLDQEYIFLEQYLSLEKLRIKEKLEFSVVLVGIEKENKILIPSLILQPLIENAIKHGVTRTKGPGTLNVNFSHATDEHYIKVDIINSGPPFQHLPLNQHKSDNTVHGMTLVQERIDLLRTYFGYGLTSITVTSPLDSDLKEGTKVTVLLPIKTR